MALKKIKYTEPATGTDVAFDECGAAGADGNVQFSKIAIGAFGTLTLVSAANPFPVFQAGLPVDVDATNTLGMTVASTNLDITLNGAGVVALEITGTWTGTINFSSIVGTTATPTAGTRQSNGILNGSANSNGTYIFHCSGWTKLRLTVFGAGGTGTATITTRATSGGTVLYQPVNLQGIMGGSISVDSGTVDSGTQRVVLPTNQPILPFDLQKWNGVAPAAAAALSDTVANPTVPSVGAHLMQWDSINSRWSRRRFTTFQVHLVSAARTANTDGSTVDIRGAKAVLAILSISSITATPLLKLRLVGATNGITYYLTPDPTAAAAVGTYVYELALGGGGTVAQAGSPAVVQRTAGVPPDGIYASIAHGDADSATYSVTLVMVY